MADSTRSILGSARALARGGGLAAWTAACTTASEAHERLVAPHQRPRIVDRHVRRWARGTLGLLGVDLHVVGPLPEAGAGARLVVANHRTALDIPILVSLFGGHFLGRADISQWPVLGAGAKKAGSVFVDRGDRHSGAAAIRAVRGLLDGGRTVTVFPEGTTLAGDVVREFNGGAFAAARGRDVEIRPVGLAYPAGLEFTQDEFLDHARQLAARPRIAVAVAIGSPVSAGESRRKTAGHAREAVQRLVTIARASLAARP